MSELPKGTPEAHEPAQDVADSLFGERPEDLASRYTSDELRSLATKYREEYDEFETPIIELENQLRTLRTQKRIAHVKWQNHIEASIIAQSTESGE